MELSFEDKVALVTGTGSQIGFGKAIALTLAREGCDIILNDIDLEGAKKTALEVESLGRKAMVVKADISRSAEVKDMVKAALQEFGKLDILVNNAGACTPPKPFLEMTEADWDSDIDINLKGMLNCTRAVLPPMIERKYGKIVNISSGAGLDGGTNIAVYAAAKAGIIVFTKAIAREVSALGINVNCVAPGMANTGFASQAPPGFIESFAKSTAVGRLTVPQDIANAVAFLASDVSSDIVGQTFEVSGSP
jgi:3-oxoacyl-[acyl-carrier protein] reductase